MKTVDSPTSKFGNLPGPGPGRPPGMPNKTTVEFRTALANLLDYAAPKMQEWIERICKDDPAKALTLIGNLAEFIHPKLSRSEFSGPNGGAIKIGKEDLTDEELIVIAQKKDDTE